MIIRLLALCALLSPWLAVGAELRVPLGQRGELVLAVPDYWRAEVRAPRPDLPPTVRITTPDAQELQMLITPLWPQGPAAQAPSAAELKSMVAAAAASASAQAEERELAVVELGAADRPGYFFSATDRAPKPGEYKYLTQGAMGLAELRVTFTILMNGKPDALRAQALELLRGIRRRNAI